MTTRIDATDVAHQLARMWPHARLHVAPTPMGYTVVLGATAAELTPDWWTVRKPDQADRYWGYVECDEVVIADTLAEANAHNFHDSVKGRVTAFDQRLKVRKVGDVYSITTAESETITIVPLGGMIAVTAGGVTHEVATMGHAIMAVGALVASTN